MEHMPLFRNNLRSIRSLYINNLEVTLADGLSLAISTGMQSSRGFTLFELLIGVALIATLSAIGLPVMNEAINRNRVWTGSEMVGAQIRQARLRAISRNTIFRVRFNCPAANQMRVLVVTGDPLIDNAADRCDLMQDLDGGLVPMPSGVTFGVVPTLEVNGRGVFSAAGGALPMTVNVSFGDTRIRALSVTATGLITFGTF